MERRELLKQVGVAAGAGAAGVAGIVVYDRFDEEDEGPDFERGEPREEPRREIPERYAEEFGTVVDAVDAGADPTGEDPINDFLAEHAASDTLLAFETGTYRLAPGVFSGLSTFGIVGIGDERPTIQPTSTRCHPGDAHLSFEAVENLLVEDVDFDFQQDGTGGSLHLFVDGDAAVRNVELTGDCPEQIAALRIDVREADGEAIVENLVATDHRQDTQLTGVYVGKSHAGTISFRDCRIEGFSDNGLYASSPGHDGGKNGNVEVVGGTFTDNNIANVRLGTTDSLARDVTIDVQSPPTLDGGVNARGIRLRKRGGHVVEDCEITIDAGAGGSFGAIVFHPDAGSAEIRNTTVDVNADSIVGINALPPSGTDVDGPVLEDVSITGSAAEGYAADLSGRNGTVFRNCTIRQNGHDRGGLRLRDATDCEIVDSEIRTTGSPVVLRRASASVENTTIATPAGTRSIDSLEAENEVLTP